MFSPRLIHDFSEKAYLEDAKTLGSGDSLLDHEFYEGRTEIDNGKYSKALTSFLNAQSLTKQKFLPKKIHAKISLYIGICYANLHKQDLAIQHYNESIENIPNGEDFIYLRARAYYKRALSHHLSKNNAAAKEDFVIAFTLTPKQAIMHELMASDY